jgi:hypothetical protein
MDRKFIITAFVYAIVGMSLGIFMAASKNHIQFVTHAHILLAGFVVSFIYALTHKLWLDNSSGLLSKIKFYVHQVGIFLMSLGLFLLYGGIVAAETIDPMLAFSSFAVLAGMILMVLLFFKSSRTAD